jgi:hypothetical protein
MDQNERRRMKGAVRFFTGFIMPPQVSIGLHNTLGRSCEGLFFIVLACGLRSFIPLLAGPKLHEHGGRCFANSTVPHSQLAGMKGGMRCDHL